MNHVRTYRLTRRTTKYVWLRPSSLGAYPPRGCSHRVEMSEFRERYVPVHNSEPYELYFRKAV